MPTSKNFELGSFANNVDHNPANGDTEISNNITLTGELRGPSTFIIDPAGIGDNTGLLQVKGNLQVDGITTTINSTTLDVDDLNITVAKGAGSAAAANGAAANDGATNDAAANDGSTNDAATRNAANAARDVRTTTTPRY